MTPWSPPRRRRRRQGPGADGRTLEFIKDQYLGQLQHDLALGAGEQLLRACGIDAALPDGQPDQRLIIASDTSAGDDFVAAIAKHRHFARETDPPRI